MKKFVCFLVLAVVTATQAETLYKVVGADGKITYTDRPPADGKTTALQFADAPSSPLPALVLKYQAELRKTMQGRLAEGRMIDSTGAVTLFGAPWCGYCKRAKSYLQTKGIRYREHDIDTVEGGRAFIEAGGQKSVPLLVADGKRLLGFTEGAYDGFFAAKK